MGIGLADGTGIVRAVELKAAATAGSAQSGAEEVDLNMLTMLTVRCYSGYGTGRSNKKAIEGLAVEGRKWEMRCGNARRVSFVYILR